MNFEIISILDRPELAETAARWFHEKWGVPREAYLESMEECLEQKSPVPQWYLALEGERIIGGLGVIENDFHDRKDLTPNVCAVYTEPDRRCQGVAGAMLDHVCADMKNRGIDTLYLVTDHTSFYERYGWAFFCMVQGDEENAMTRMYIHRKSSVIPGGVKVVDIHKLSSKYCVKKLTTTDVDAIYALSVENPMFFEYCPPFVTRDSILDDMKALPPGSTYEDKYYIGFFKDGRLIAIMDMILNYPNAETAFIGLFMVCKGEQGKGVGSDIINECASFVRKQGYRFMRLGFAKGNPQSEAFWRKNGFIKTGVEKESDNYTVVVMEKTV